MIEMTSRLDLRPDHWDIVCAILSEHVPDRRVLAFGSRSTWTAKEYSDLDLAILGDEPLPLVIFSAMSEEFSESELPFKVDIVEWARIDEAFREKIRRDGVTVQISKRNLEAGYQTNMAIRSEHEIERKSVSLTEDLKHAKSSWQTLSLGECIVMNDSTYSPKESWPNVNYLETGSITENRIANTKYLRLDKDKLPSRARRKVQSGDIVYSTVRPNQKHFGLLKNIPENFLASTGFAVFRGKSGIADTGFIYWFVTQEHVIEKLQVIAEHSTSAYPSIRPSDIEQLAINLPSLREQRAIAHILGTLDEKIELNLYMNQTLEEMAEALFTSWFVEFEPVRAVMEGRDTGIPRHLADLFPNRLVDSESGEVPEGWETYRLEEISEHHKETIAPYRHPSTIFEHFSIPAYDKRQMPIIEFGESIKSNKTCIPSDSILLSKLNPEISRVWLPNNNEGRNQICSTEFLVFSGRAPGNQFLLYSLFKSKSFRNKMKSMVTGTSKSHQRVPVDDLKNQHVITGTPAIFDCFNKVISFLFKQALKNRSESEMLSNIRKTLLPKLMSDEVNVTDSISTLLHIHR